MSSTLSLITEWPTIVYSVLLCVALLYWLMGIIGLVDANHHGLQQIGHGHVGDIGHADHVGHAVHTGHVSPIDHPGSHGDVQVEGEKLSTIASYAVAFGLTSVPISLVVSLIVLFAWTASALATRYLLPMAPIGTLRILSSFAIIALALIPGIFFTALLSRPLRGLFISHPAPPNENLVGQRCRVLTLKVTEDFGQGEISNRGASFKIMISSRVPNTLGAGAMAHVIAYDAANRRFLVAPDEEG